MAIGADGRECWRRCDIDYGTRRLGRMINVVCRGTAI